MNIHTLQCFRKKNTHRLCRVNLHELNKRAGAVHELELGLHMNTTGLQKQFALLNVQEAKK